LVVVVFKKLLKANGLFGRKLKESKESNLFGVQPRVP
jgi:hypothetical protein